jgi:SAM-dependent methyltransferase
MAAPKSSLAEPAIMTDQEEILRSLERHARRYNEWVLERALPYVGERILEAGAGVGTFTVMLAREDRRVFANELDLEFAELLEKRAQVLPNVDVLRNDLLQVTPELLGGPVDSIICFNVLEHIPRDVDAVAAMRRCLRPGGQLLLLVPAHPFLYGATDRAVDHERRYTRGGLSRLLGRNGFEIEELRYVNPVGAAGWFVSSKVLRRSTLPKGPLNVFGRLVPVLRFLDRLRMPFGLSVWARARPR